MPTQTLSTGESPRSKRKVILDAAIDHFGEVGFEHTKWATIASQVGIGQAALYHYFESKSHCCSPSCAWSSIRALRVSVRPPTASRTPKALAAAITSAYEGASPRDALQRRILQNHMDLLSTPRQSEREEAERQRSRELVREIEAEWAALIRRGIKAGIFAKQDAHLATRLVLGLVVSIWRWYRPGGPLSLDQITEMVKNASLKMLRP